jgi:uncharacterized membrane protein YcjF (UPF0283 family)
MTTWTAEEIEEARHELTLAGIDVEDMDDALAGSLALATQEVRKRRIWPYIVGFVAAAVCFAFMAWNLITIAPAVW